MSQNLKGSTLLNEDGFFHGKTGFRKVLSSGQLNMYEVIFVFLAFETATAIETERLVCDQGGGFVKLMEYLKQLIRVMICCTHSSESSRCPR